MAIQHLLLVVFMASILHAAASSSATTNSTLAAATAYDVLEQNKLPRGLLPQGVKSYSLMEGALDVTLPYACDFSVSVDGEQYRFRYSRAVGGAIQPGSMTHVYGVALQAEVAWLGFDVQVQRVGNHLSFQLRSTNVTLPVSAFAQSPSCAEV